MDQNQTSPATPAPQPPNTVPAQSSPDPAANTQQAATGQSAPVQVPATISKPLELKKKRAFTAEQIKAQSVNIVKATGAIAVFLLLFNILGLLVSRSMFERYQTLKTQIATTQNQSRDLENAVSFLQSQQDKIERINSALPNESSLVVFIQTLEAIANSSATSSNLNFSALAPTGNPNQKYIPFKIELTTDRPNFEDFLSKLEKLPYIIELSGIELDSEGLPNGLWKITINAKVYVQDPFAVAPGPQVAQPPIININR